MQIKRFAILLVLAALAAAVFMLDRLAQINYLYWIYWWYDIMMHFLGGVVIGGSAAWGYRRFATKATFHRTLLVAFVAIIFIGIGWEIYEYMMGMYVGQVNVVFDTSLDLVMDTIGALATASLVAFFLKERPQVSTTTTNS